ncbi:hypothetical protein DFR24_0265 [Panacagrimonas perspica]|uniref:Uncharacterized protein n=1 Tax=Panacagrimonas perspica TaxID=381431 RepID=A0A4R7PAH3_9GAMM|nr:hypothetical protein [Panacagrimonas perspica]TDU30908.1 hypothetical protein DFR24_0265 [Panacagrimonas perspica]THD01938.1 hypothetical protein B1810_18245 [Panacagrimonas perspica]
MSAQRPDVSRLFQHFGLDPSDYLHFAEPAKVVTALAASLAPGGSADAARHEADPAARAAQLRARLLQDRS